ncbi:hypothetical protein FACS189475_01580 [Betaproteobacteria bacterium]|nr:hypothetical protein FACS189475_01580 [Betaproteobacteria bacterium]
MLATAMNGANRTAFSASFPEIPGRFRGRICPKPEFLASRFGLDPEQGGITKMVTISPGHAPANELMVYVDVANVNRPDGASVMVMSGLDHHHVLPVRQGEQRLTRPPAKSLPFFGSVDLRETHAHCLPVDQNIERIAVGDSDDAARKIGMGRVAEHQCNGEQRDTKQGHSVGGQYSGIFESNAVDFSRMQVFPGLRSLC